MQNNQLNALAIELGNDELIDLETLLSVEEAGKPDDLDDRQVSDLKKRDEEQADDAIAQSDDAVDPAMLVASLDNDLSGYIDASTDHQVATQPPEGGATNGNSGNSYTPLIWTAAGVLGIAALDEYDKDDDSGSATNRAPSFPEPTQELSTDEDQPLDIVAVASDRDGDELTYEIFTDPQHGTVTEGSEPGLYIYTPDANFAGDDSFIVRVTDSEGSRAVQTIAVTVNDVNDAPVLEENVYAKVAVDTLYQISIGASDVEGDSLSYSFTEAANGVVTPGDSTGIYFYTPNSGYTGEDSFTVTVSDGELESTQTIYLRVGLGNADPVTDESLSLSTDEDQDISFDVSAYDPDGDALSYSATVPEHGNVVQDGNIPGRFTYTPDANFYGQDSFTVTIEDGNGGTTTQFVTVDVAAGTEDDVYTLTVDDVEMEEGDDGTTTMVFTLKLDGAPFDEEVVVAVEAIDGSATSGDDFNLLTSSVTFISGQDTATVEVEIIGDNSFGADEAFELKFSGEKLTDDVTASGTILNDDPNPNEPVYTLTVESESLVEPNSSLTNLSFELKLDRAAESDFTINVALTDIDTTVGSDYIALSFDTVTFAAGEDTATVTVRVRGDTTFETDEQFQLKFSNIQLTENVTVTGTILNNDINPNATAPVITLVAASDSGSSDSDGITNLTTPTFEIIADAGAQVDIMLDNSVVGTATETSPGIYSYTAEALADGDYAFYAKVSYPNVSTSLLSNEVDVTIDTSAPEVSSISTNADDNTVTVVFSEALGLFDDTEISFTVNDILANITGTTNDNADTLVFQLQEDIVAGDIVDIAMTTGAVSDVAGNDIGEILAADDPTGVVV
jgi:large repetitive protein